MRRVVIALAAGFALAAVSAAQEPAQFTSGTDLVVLHVNVKDKHGAYVTDLRQESFTVFEDGRPQTIRFFAKEDTPVTMGLLVDSSASMFARRDEVIAAAAAFTAASNPQDELFALLFNERVRPVLSDSKPFTSDRDFFRFALERIFVPSGRTALFDAVNGGLEYLRRGRYERRDLVLISDGGDNASRMTFEQVIARTQASSALVYTVALSDRIGRGGNPKLLERLAHATGGEAFGPKDERRIKQTLIQIAQDVRQTYTLGYVSTNTARDGGFRQVRVAADAPDRRPLVIRTRDGYRAAGTPAAVPTPSSIDVTSASRAIDVRTETIAPRVPAYRIVVANRSTRALLAMQYEIFHGATRVAGGRRKSERNEPIAAPGRSYAFEIQPGSAIDRLAITSVVWEDGAIEGDGVLAADERMLDIGKAIQLRRVLKLLHEFEERNGEPAVHAFRARATALTLIADVPLTDASRTGMQQVKDALMKDLDLFEHAPGVRPSGSFATWITDTTGAYEEWLARIAAR
jgi:VWFA-related protein